MEDPDIRNHLNEAIQNFYNDLDTPRKRQASITSPPLSRRTSSTQPLPRTNPIDIPQRKPSSRATERHRSSYGSTPLDGPTFDESIQIERERQPYVAQPGNGRVYTETLGVPHTTGRDRADSASRATKGPDYEPHVRHHRPQSTTSNTAYVPASRPGGARRPPSPPMQKFSHSTPLNLDTGTGYIYDAYSPPNHTQSAASYIPSSRLPLNPQPEPRERERDYERDRERGRHGESRRHERDYRRNTADEQSSRRSIIDETVRAASEITDARDLDRLERLYEERDKSSEPRYGNRGPVLHQEPRSDARSSVPGEEFYRGNVLQGGEYDTGRSKYYPRSENSRR
jgi:hypothetical protein